MRPFEACPFCNGEFMFDWINDTRRCNNCGALFTWRIIREPSGVPIDLTLQLKKAEDRITELKAENDELKERVAMLDVTAVYKSLGEMGYIEQVDRLTARIAELEAERRWISVSERLPEEGKVVYVISMNYIEYFTNTELVYETAVLVEIDGVKMFGFVNEFSVWSSNDVTHWMYAIPFPKPAEVQE